MVDSIRPGYPRVIPYLLYEDVGKALEWIVTALGFTESFAMPGPDGQLLHAEVELGGGVVMIGCPAADYQNPRRLGGATQIVYVYVEDVDGHYARAKAAGAEIVRELADEFYGDRVYGAVDPEGHLWNLAQHVRDVPPEEMHP